MFKNTDLENLLKNFMWFALSLYKVVKQSTFIHVSRLSPCVVSPGVGVSVLCQAERRRI